MVVEALTGTGRCVGLDLPATLAVGTDACGLTGWGFGEDEGGDGEVERGCC